MREYIITLNRKNGDLMNNDLISVVIIVYNTAKYLEECIDSIINQTYKNLDIIIVNDGSSDNSAEIIEEYAKKDSRITFINRTNNKGTMFTRQEGFNNSKGKYITFVDSDDFLKLNAIEIMYNDLLKNNVEFVKSNFIRYSNNKFFDNKNIIKKQLKIDKKEFEPVLYDLLYKTIYLNSMCGNLVLKEKLKCIEKVDPKSIFGEDLQCNILMFENLKSIFFESKELYVYRVNPTSITQTVDERKIEKKLNDSINCYYNILMNINNCKIKNTDKYRSYISEKYLYLLSMIFVDYSKKMKYKNFKRLFLKIYNLEKSRTILSNNNNKYLLKTNILTDIIKKLILKKKKFTIYILIKGVYIPAKKIHNIVK